MNGLEPKLKKTVTRADLYEAVYQKVGLSRRESASSVDLVLREVTDCFERGELVKLSGFGSFLVRKKGIGWAATRRPARRRRSWLAG
jgi:integration host factor subunit alpha